MLKTDQRASATSVSNTILPPFASINSIEKDIRKSEGVAKNPRKHLSDCLRALASHSNKIPPISLMVIFHPCDWQELHDQNLYFKLTGAVKT